MNFQDLKSKNKEFTDKINAIRKEQDSFQVMNQEVFDKLFKEKQKEDYDWFVAHLDYIWKHKDYLKTHSPFQNIVIDFLHLYEDRHDSRCFCGTCGGLILTADEIKCNSASYGGYIRQSGPFFLSDLISLWEEGFLYNNCPIIKIYKHSFGLEKKYRIAYVKEKTPVSVEIIGKDDKHFTDKKCEKFLKRIKKIEFSVFRFNPWEDYATIDLLKKACQTHK